MVKKESISFVLCVHYGCTNYEQQRLFGYLFSDDSSAIEPSNLKFCMLCTLPHV